MPEVKLTKTMVDKALPPVNKDQEFYRDTQLKGFGLRVTARGAKSFIVEKRIGRKTRRNTIGSYPALTVDQARKLAQQLLGKIASGVDPLAEKRRALAESVQLCQAFGEYLETRTLKPNTVFDYRRVMREAFPDWQKVPITTITRSMVEHRYRELGQRSKARANNAMRVLRAVLNFATARYTGDGEQPILTANPVQRLSDTKSWYPVDRKQTVIKESGFKAWFEAVLALGDEDPNSYGSVARDLLRTLVFTGLRRDEARNLRWENIDFAENTLTVPDTKNRTPHILPLPEYLLAIFQARRDSATSDFVFPGRDEAHPVVNINRHKESVVKNSGIHFSLHDLRRTFITTAESLDISIYTVKRLANHKLSKGDVTAGYVVTNVSRLRKPMQMISEHLLKLVE
ncbi:MAG: integrase family protein [Chromatiaceae bacterium]|nr:integrase family protein [Chromatiaceae bacterium]MCP5315228.1 integrase family protein [Chromatiaceae bacterium]MCP5428655.1 integrase family protein [Chromatiaceae bacterium]